MTSICACIVCNMHITCTCMCEGILHVFICILGILTKEYDLAKKVVLTIIMCCYSV